MSYTSGVLLGCCSDTHGQVLPHWNGRGIAAVLHAGDVYDAPSLIEDDDDPLARASAQSVVVPLFAVRGNHDHADPGGFFRSAKDLSPGRLYRLSPKLWVGGIGFAPRRYYDLPGESDLEPSCVELARQARHLLAGDDEVILLTHYPPKLPEMPCGDVPATWTYGCIASLVEELRPAAVIQGHVHEWFGKQWRSGPTLVVSPGPVGCVLALAPAAEEDELPAAPRASVLWET